MMRSINENVEKLTQWVCSIVLDIINEEYVLKMLKLVSSLNTSKEECCEYLLQLLNEFVRLYEQITRLNFSKQELIPLGNLE